MTVADVAIYLPNNRNNHNYKNSRMSCSKLIMNTRQFHKKDGLKMRDCHHRWKLTYKKIILSWSHK